MLPTDIADYLNGKSEAEARAAHQQHHERLHAPSVILTPSKDAAANVAALRAAIAAATFTQNSYGYGGEVLVAPGLYPLNETIEIRGAFGLRLCGVGAASTFVWRGAADQPMFRLVMSRECVLSDMRMRMELPGYAALQVMRDNGLGFSPTHNRFNNLLIQCDNTTAYGVVLGGVGSMNATNDFSLFDHCTLEKYTDTGVWMDGSQAYNQMFNNCKLTGGIGAQYGYYTGTVGASISVMGGFLNNHAAADFYLCRSYQPHLIRFINSEDSARFIESPAMPYRQVLVEGCRWAGNRLHEDGRAIITTGLLYMVLNSCSIGNGGDGEKLLYLHFASVHPYEGGGVIMMGCRIYSAAKNVFFQDAPARVDISSKITDEGKNITVPLTTAG